MMGNGYLQAPLLIGPLPPPINGQSLMFEILVHGYEQHGRSFQLVNLAQGPRAAMHIGRFSLVRAAEYTRFLAIIFFQLATCRGSIYLTVSQSRRGFIRDMI